MINGLLKNKILITGGSGRIGAHIDFGVKPNRKELDILNIRSIKQAMEKYKPKVVIHMAAFTDLNECEKNPSKAYDINSVGTYNIATESNNYGAKMIYISTCAVFSGNKIHKENESPSPVNVYGRTKYIGELITKDILSDWIIIRPGWLFGYGIGWENKFVDLVFRKLNAGEKVFATYNRFGSPTYVLDFVEKMKDIINGENKNVIFNVANSGSVSYYDIALEIAKIIDVNTALVKKNSYKFMDGDIIRPRLESITSNKIKMRTWENAIYEYIMKISRKSL